MEAKKYFEFDPKKLKKVKVDDVRENYWNPKDPDDPDYQKVLRSIQINGLTQPIFVRENDDGTTKYEILDGAHRWRAAYELGIDDIYVYDEGEVPDELAKSLTIWHEVSVKSQKELLAPLAMELNKLNMELPFSDKEMFKFEKIASQDFDDMPKTDMDGFKDLKIRMTQDQFEVVMNAIKTVAEKENVSDGRALELLVSSGLAGYPFDGTDDE